MTDYLKTTKKSVLISGIFFSLLILLVALLSIKSITPASFPKETKFFISRKAIWVCLYLIYSYTVFIEKQRFLLWPEKKYSISLYVKLILKLMLTLFAILFCASLLMKLTGTFVESEKIKELTIIFKSNSWLLLFTCLTAGITEELIFRGFLMPRLELLLKNRNLAIALSSILFGALHFGYGTLLQVIGPTCIGFAFAIHYYKYRNVKIVIICHFVWDLLVILSKISHLQ
jgi:membrane protease YdiL (CAAX protease family)